MNNSASFSSYLTKNTKKQILLIGQFFLIIFVYHILKDLKDTLVITASDAGAQVIPFIKIWVMLPMAVLAGFVFSKLFLRFGRTTTLYIIVAALLSTYALFAFCLYPLREHLVLNQLADQLEAYLPSGMDGFVSMVRYWIYTFFYLAAELWAVIVLSVLFWGYVNDVTPMDEAKKFYPICLMVGNCAGVLAGQTSCVLCHAFKGIGSWEQTLQWVILIVMGCGIVIMTINALLARENYTSVVDTGVKVKKPKVSFRESVQIALQSKRLLAIAVLVVGFGLTSNLLEVIWKEKIKSVYALPQEYNGYVNQLTSIIGFLAVVIAFASRWMFKQLKLSTIIFITPVLLFATSFLFFGSLIAPKERLETISAFFSVTPAYFMITLGSIHYVLALTAKYTIFDTSKEMSYLALDPEMRIKGKAVIDCVGSRLGKSGSSTIYQILLVTMGSGADFISIIGLSSVLMIGTMIYSAHQLKKEGKVNLTMVTQQ